MIALLRRYRFEAAHVLSRAEWSDGKNREIYGKCANPAGHGHNYELEIEIAGEPDPASGMLLPAGQIDASVARRVLAELDGKLLNRDCETFRRDVPTAENIARFAWTRLADAFAPLVLRRVRLVETPNNSVEYSGDSHLAEGP